MMQTKPPRAAVAQPTQVLPLPRWLRGIKDDADLPAKITAAAMQKRCPTCVETLELFISAYGAETGNLALRMVATAGVYIGGGIAPKILGALESGSFLDAFRAKEPMADLIATIPVSVILNSDAGLLGAAVHGGSVARGR